MHRPEALLPYRNPDLDARYGPGNWGIGMVEWGQPGPATYTDDDPMGGYGGDHIQLEVAEARPGNFLVRGTLEASHDTASVRALFLGFAGNVSAAPGSTRQSWADAFVASRQPGGYLVAERPEGGLASQPIPNSVYVVNITGPLRLEEFVEETGGWDPAEPEPRGGSGWLLHSSFAIKTATRSSLRDTFEVTVSATDDVAWRHTGSTHYAPAELAQRFNETVSDLGLPPPAIQDLRFERSHGD